MAKKRSDEKKDLGRSTSANFRKSLNPAVLQMAIIAILCMIAYSNSFHVPFTFDDEPSVSDNSIVHDIGNFFFNLSGYDYNPRRFIGYLTFALNYHFGGLNVAGYHAVNLAIHIATSLLVYLLVLLTFRTPAMRPQSSALSPQSSALSPCSSVLSPQSSFFSTSNLIAFFSAALFAVHPIQTEAVTYIVQRLTSLTAFFYLLSLTAYIKFRIIAEGKAPASGGAKNAVPYAPCALRFATYAVSLVSAVLAMKTKEIAFTLPFIIVLYDLVFFGTRKLTRRILWLLPLLSTTAIIPLSLLSMTVHTPLGKVLSDVSQVTVVQTAMSRWEYLITEFTVIVKYIKLLFFPVGQNLDYDYPIYRSFFYPQVMLSFLFLLFLFGLGIYLLISAKRRESASGGAEDKAQRAENAMPYALPQAGLRLMGFGILWFFITISVESSIIPITDVIFEHRMYLPSIGLIICVVTGIFQLAEKVEHSVFSSQSSPLFSTPVKIIVGILSLAIILLSAATYLRNNVWKDNISLWKDTMTKSPDKARPHYNLAFRYRVAGMFDKALEQNMLAVKLAPGCTEVRNNLGESYQSLNMPDKALEQYLIAVKLKPDYAEAHYNLGVLYHQSLNMPDKAINEYLTAIRLKPDRLEPYNNLGDIYQSLNMPGKALEQYLMAVKLNPDYAEAHYNLGNVYKSLNTFNKALEQYMIAVTIKPDYIAAHNNLAILYQTLNMPDKAAKELQTLILLDPNNATAHFNLGALYYNMGQMEKARNEFMTRLRLQPDDKKTRQLVDQISHLTGR